MNAYGHQIWTRWSQSDAVEVKIKLKAADDVIIVRSNDFDKTLQLNPQSGYVKTDVYLL